jgi:5-methylcytosine-specific restriction protein A
MMRACRHPGCGELVRSGRCPAHTQEVEQRRGSSAARGYGHRWRLARAAYLRQHPLCVACQAQGKTAAATEVDHVLPHRGDARLMWSQHNWQPLCQSCHSRKTAMGL